MNKDEAIRKAIDAERAGDKATAVTWFRYAADLGDANAQYCLAYNLERGLGCARDMDQAIRYYGMAARQGDVSSQVKLGVLYYNGEDVEQDYETAAYYFGMAADQGDAQGQFNLAYLYKYGQGVPQDYEKAVELMKLSADQGFAAANVNLGHCYEEGTGVAQNRDLALMRYMFAAEAGNELGQREYDRLKAEFDAEEDELNAQYEAEMAAQAAAEEAAAQADSLDETLAELNALIGLRGVKEQVQRLINRMKVNQARRARGMNVPSTTNHCVFTGNPGTGKTTVARIMAKIFKALGVVSKGQLVETDRGGLVGEYIGQTAIKTKEVIDSAIGGVLFIDEAYALVGKGEKDFGTEAIETLLKMMEDNRGDLVVIAAGYKKEMEDFIAANPGLESRFQNFIEFEDYNADELLEIFSRMCDKNGFVLSADAREALGALFGDMVANKTASFANGREARKVFDWILEAQADRLVMEVGDLTNVDEAVLTTITAADVDAAATRLSR